MEQATEKIHKPRYIRKANGAIGVDIFLAQSPEMAEDLLAGRYEKWSYAQYSEFRVRYALCAWVGYIDGLDKMRDAIPIARNPHKLWWEHPQEGWEIAPLPLLAGTIDYGEIEVPRRPIQPGDLLLSDDRRQMNRNRGRILSGTWHIISRGWDTPYIPTTYD